MKGKKLTRIVYDTKEKGWDRRGTSRKILTEWVGEKLKRRGRKWKEVKGTTEDTQGSSEIWRTMKWIILLMALHLTEKDLKIKKKK